MGAYWSYLTRPQPPIPNVRVAWDLLPTLEVDFFRFTALFCCIYSGCKYGIKFGFPKFYASLDERKQSEYYAYLACLFHHFAAVAIALYTIYHDIFNLDPSSSATRFVRSLSFAPPFSSGYLVADILFSCPGEVRRGNYENLVHHTIGFGLIFFLSVNSHPHTSRYIPHVLLTELSTIFFTIAWLLRSAGWRHSKLVALLERLFAVAFFLTRIVHLPCVFAAILYTVPNHGVTSFAFMAGVIALQLFWFYKIAQSVLTRGASSSEKKQP